MPPIGRFAPSPTSDLHLGNLRTALAAWLLARASGGGFIVRNEDLDTQRVSAASGVAARQLADLAAIGLDWDGAVVSQSDRLGLYADAISALGEDVYPCFCTRREIAEAASAPHDGYRAYPGTCARLSSAQRAEKARTRAPALRVRAGEASFTVRDLHAGEVTGEVDDFVLLRGDGTPAYNLAVVVDDAAQGITQVTRGDDLLASAPRQAWLADRLGLDVPEYAHVSLVVNGSGQRLAKRDGAVTLTDLSDHPIGETVGWLTRSLGLGTHPTPQDALANLPDGFTGTDSWWRQVVWLGKTTPPPRVE